MQPFALLSLVLVAAAILAWLNHRFLRLPTTIGVMVIALAMSALLLAAEALGFSIRAPVASLLDRLDFGHAVLDILLAFLLFAGALHVNLEDLMGQRRVIAILATVGVVACTFLVGGLIWALCAALGVPIPLLHGLLFGALIAPTDPIAVLGILKRVGAPPSLKTKIVGESLFNDGIGVVVFALLASMVGTDGAGPGMAEAAGLFAREVGGAVVLGLGTGWIAYRMLRAVDNYQVEVLVTLALCTGLYSLAAALHASGPLAVVFAGLLVGNTGRKYAMSATTVEHLDTFWELVDEILNVVLFVLIGMEVLVLPFASAHVAAGLLAIPLVLLARLTAVGGVVSLLRRRRTFTPHAVKIMTWAGLRGGISVALALSLSSDFASRDLILTMTYVVVVFSIVGQGLTVGKMMRRIPATAVSTRPGTARPSAPQPPPRR